MSEQPYAVGTRVVIVRHIPTDEGGTFLGKTATVNGTLWAGEAAILCGRKFRASVTVNIIELDCDLGSECVLPPEWLRPLSDPDPETIEQTDEVTA